MTLYSVQELADLVKLTRQAIYKAIRKEELLKRSDGKIDITDRINAAWISARETKKPKTKPCKPQKKKFTPEPEFRPIKSGDLPLDDPDDDDDMDMAEKVNQAKLEESRARTNRHNIATGKDLDILCLRSLVEQHDAQVGIEINRFISSCRTINKRYRAKVLSGETEKETQTFLEDEMTAITKAVKLALEDF